MKKDYLICMGSRIAEMMKCLFHRQETMLNRYMEKYELTYAQMQTLLYIMDTSYIMDASDTGIVSRDIEERFCISNPTASGIIKRLEQKGFIVRRVCEKDGRVKFIYLTAKGYLICTETRRGWENALRESFYNMTEDEMEDVQKILEKILKKERRNETA